MIKDKNFISEKAKTIPPYPNFVNSVRSLTLDTVFKNFPNSIEKHKNLQIKRDEFLSVARNNITPDSSELENFMFTSQNENIEDELKKLWQAMDLPVLAYYQYKCKQWQKSYDTLQNAIELDNQLSKADNCWDYLIFHVLHLRTNQARIHSKASKTHESLLIYNQVLNEISQNENSEVFIQFNPIKNILVRQIADDLSAIDQVELETFDWTFANESNWSNSFLQYLKKSYSEELLNEDPSIFGIIWQKNAKVYLNGVVNDS